MVTHLESYTYNIAEQLDIVDRDFLHFCLVKDFWVLRQGFFAHVRCSSKSQDVIIFSSVDDKKRSYNIARVLES